MDKVVIVIPVYKEKFSALEKVSYDQVKNILGRYPLCFIAPEKLKGSDLFKNHPVEYFPDLCFDGRDNYSKLMLNPEFYGRFIRYRYMLLYQLDAFVFNDRLIEFCDMRYDYIGAPVPRYVWPRLSSRVGNGGFSLRNVISCIRVTEKKEEIFSVTGRQKEFENEEDKYFAFCGNISELKFSVPKAKIAERFSIEADVGHCYKRISKQHLPFGCHAWTKPEFFYVWKPYIEEYFENVEEIFQATNKGERSQHDARKYIIYRYLIKRAMRDKETIKEVFCKIFPMGERYIVWGNGMIGHEIIEILRLLNREVCYIFDKECQKTCADAGYKVTLPDEEIIALREYMILVATSRYESGICRELICRGLEKGIDFLTYTDILFRVIKNRYEPIMKNIRNSLANL